MGSRKQLVGMSWNPKRCLYLRDQGATDSDGSDMDTEMPAGTEAISGPSAEAEKLMRESEDSQLMSVDADMLPDIVESRPGGNRYSCYLFDYLLICAIPGSAIIRGGVGGVSGSSLPSARSRLSRKKVFARDLVATTSSKTEKLSGSVGGFSFHVQRTTVNVQRALKYMPETRSSSKDAEIIDLVDDDDGAGPSRRYCDFLHPLFVL